MINLSSAMGGQFAWSAAEFTEEIRRMGPNPLRREAQEVDSNPQGDSPPAPQANEQ